MTEQKINDVRVIIFSRFLTPPPFLLSCLLFIIISVLITFTASIVYPLFDKQCWFIFRDSRFVLYSKVFFLTAWNLVVAGLVRLGYLLRLDRLLNSIRNSRSRYRPQPNMGDGNGLNELLFDTNSNDMQEGLLSNNGTGQG